MVCMFCVLYNSTIILFLHLVLHLVFQYLALLLVRHHPVVPLLLELNLEVLHLVQVGG